MQTSCSFSFQNLLHLIDLRLLASDDAAAKLPDFGIRKLRLLAHQDSARMMGNHRAEKSRVADRCLGPDERKAPEEGYSRSQQQKIGRAHACTPVTNAHLVCRLLIEKKNNDNKTKPNS